MTIHAGNKHTLDILGIEQLCETSTYSYLILETSNILHTILYVF